MRKGKIWQHCGKSTKHVGMKTTSAQKCERKNDTGKVHPEKREIWVSRTIRQKHSWNKIRRGGKRRIGATGPCEGYFVNCNTVYTLFHRLLGAG